MNKADQARSYQPILGLYKMDKKAEGRHFMGMVWALYLTGKRGSYKTLSRLINLVIQTGEWVG